MTAVNLVLPLEARDPRELERQLEAIFLPRPQSTCRHCGGVLSEEQFGHFKCHPCAARRGR
ncbi:hypothetical protein [Deinococcus peraridilitoris]|uniref:Uncharacterized protein n=1 Tax=Deinococcus peraridilitoris (strain DSM 19664 / LMG 22246 / CIP 109416 / KR-200) TaxID=937777 RepID=K9ZY10_DEIPD|nr:hypothetical protein [Deinococcus peraridilitoris]AFZ66084.1 hypothetical protein Deipe_0488 [Deinococcus peraridilitoris DSM 19664]